MGLKVNKDSRLTPLYKQCKEKSAVDFRVETQSIADFIIEKHIGFQGRDAKHSRFHH